MSINTDKSIRERRQAKRAGTESRMYRGGLGNTSKDTIRRGVNKTSSPYGGKLSEKY